MHITYTIDLECQDRRRRWRSAAKAEGRTMASWIRYHMDRVERETLDVNGATKEEKQAKA